MKPEEFARIEALFEHYQPLMRFASQLCNNPAKAMTLTQRTMRAAVERSRWLPVPSNVRSWLLSILLNKYLETRQRAHAA